MPLVERNHRVEQLAAAAPHPTLGNTILPGTFEGGPRGVRGDLVRPPGCARGWSAYAERSVPHSSSAEHAHNRDRSVLSGSALR